MVLFTKSLTQNLKFIICNYFDSYWIWNTWFCRI